MTAFKKFNSAEKHLNVGSPTTWAEGPDQIEMGKKRKLAETLLISLLPATGMGCTLKA